MLHRKYTIFVGLLNLNFGVLDQSTNQPQADTVCHNVHVLIGIFIRWLMLACKELGSVPVNIAMPIFAWACTETLVDQVHCKFADCLLLWCSFSEISFDKLSWLQGCPEFRYRPIICTDFQIQTNFRFRWLGGFEEAGCLDFVPGNNPHT